MSYVKTNWQAGDTITAEKLNNIENGIEAADKPEYAPENVTGEGDVSITYNGNQIGVLSDSGTLTLNTGMKRVEHDIDIEYTKQAGGSLSRTYGFYTVDTALETSEKISDITGNIGDIAFQLPFSRLRSDTVLYYANSEDFFDVSSRFPVLADNNTVGEKAFYFTFPNLDDTAFDAFIVIEDTEG